MNKPNKHDVAEETREKTEKKSTAAALVGLQLALLFPNTGFLYLYLFFYISFLNCFLFLVILSLYTFVYVKLNRYDWYDTRNLF